MKIIIATLFLSVTVQAQTFTRYVLTNFDSQGSGSMTILVPTNTIFKGTLLNGGQGFGWLTVQYQDTGQITYGAGEPYSESEKQPVIGPATIIFNGQNEDYPATPNTNCACILLAEFDPVNTTPAIQGFAVQPANSTAQIGLETSTDLKNWQATTNGTYGLTNSARFFRMNLTVQQ